MNNRIPLAQLPDGISLYGMEVVMVKGFNPWFDFIKFCWVKRLCSVCDRKLLPRIEDSRDFTIVWNCLFCLSLPELKVVIPTDEHVIELVSHDEGDEWHHE